MPSLERDKAHFHAARAEQPLALGGLSGARETTTRGFFAVDIGEAVRAALAEPFRRDANGFVPGVVRDSAATAGPCHLDEVLPNKHNRVRDAITSATHDRYHLLRYNCQHWATENARQMTAVADRPIESRGG